MLEKYFVDSQFSRCPINWANIRIADAGDEVAQLELQGVVSFHSIRCLISSLPHEKKGPRS